MRVMIYRMKKDKEDGGFRFHVVVDVLMLCRYVFKVLLTQF